jgi:signal transduction histidine kinase
MISRAAQTTAIAFTTDIDPIDNAVPKEMEIHFYRIIQECINNIIKHANATTAKVSIKRWSERLIIDVEDNGKGFDIEDQRIKETQGFGLHGIIERTRLLGGYVKTESVPDKGTRILITIKTNER